MTTVAVHGADGRMGTRIIALAGADEDIDSIIAIGSETASDDVDKPDVIIDFSTPEGSMRAAALACQHEAALVVCTTGLSTQNVQVLDDSARSVPVLVAPNTSLGIAVLRYVAAEAARLLPPSFDIEIVDAHHARKVDAPSGTALAIAASIKERGGRDVAADAMHSIRAGDIVGEHEIFFAGDHQILRLGHSAGTRDVFASGALHAAKWLIGRDPGRYSIEDALGLPASH